LYVSVYGLSSSRLLLNWRGLRKKKRVVDVDVFTRFSFLNIFIIAPPKRKVKARWV